MSWKIKLTSISIFLWNLTHNEFALLAKINKNRPETIYLRFAIEIFWEIWYNSTSWIMMELSVKYAFGGLLLWNTLKQWTRLILRLQLRRAAAASVRLHVSLPARLHALLLTRSARDKELSASKISVRSSLVVFQAGIAWILCNTGLIFIFWLCSPVMPAISGNYYFPCGWGRKVGFYDT